METLFWSFKFHGPECHNFTRTKPLVLPEAILSKGLTQSKTLDCELLVRLGRHPEVYNLTGQVVCLAAELVLLPKQNFKSFKLQKETSQLVRDEFDRSEILLLKSAYL